ncbi:prealbumin-like fold domain-containing protein, partial [Oscillibacter sp. MSJ-31]|nr:prealbumin-like fold domain-containing protein [Oscillibacter sp. MSJ-31]
DGLADGRYYLREIKAADGYVLDPELKTIYLRYGSTTEIEYYTND